MKKIRFASFLLVFTCVLLVISCKKHKCPEGFDCIDNSCVCGEGKFQGNGMCRALKPNEYYASLGNCLCKDTVFFEVVEKTDRTLRARLDLGWGVQENTISLIDLPDGDSLYTEAGAYTGELACPIEGRLTSTQIFGKFIENDSKIRVTLKYVAYPSFEEELGRCEFVLHQ